MYLYDDPAHEKDMRELRKEQLRADIDDDELEDIRIRHYEDEDYNDPEFFDFEEDWEND